MISNQLLSHTSPAITANMYADVSFVNMHEGLNGLYDEPR